MGRRWGKTVLGGVIVSEVWYRGGKVAWVTPTYKNSRPLWRWCLATYSPLVKAKMAGVSKTERTIVNNRGGYLAMYSGDNIDSIRGEAFSLVVVDEAARIPEHAWSDAIMPTLADYDGDAVLISTPKGKNWFFAEWLRGQEMSEEYASWTAPSSANPMPQIQKAFGKVRSRVTDDTFRQEWMAEFIEGGLVFRGVMECATAQPAEPNGTEYIFGVDWGKHNDFTVISVLDNQGRMVAMDRFNQIDYTLQVGRLTALAETYKPAVIIAERNSMGDPLAENLQQAGLPVQPFTTTNASKASAIEALALAFERREIEILNDPVLVGELQAYEMERLPSGMLRYNAPSGMHDDCVMSLALAWQGVADSGPLLYW